MTAPKSILFVCLGNICRSPSAEGVMRQYCKQAKLDILLDSAGTAGYHIGESPDHRAIKAGQTLGYDLQALRARQVKLSDFYQFDLILAMDHQNLDDLQKLRKIALDQAKDKSVADLRLFDPSGRAVADPYYGEQKDFLVMFEHLQDVANDLIKDWQEHQTL